MLTKQKYKKQMARILTVLLAVAVTVCFVPQMNAPAYAEDGGVPAMVLGSESVLKDTANTDNAQTVWYAGKAWRVIKYKDTGNDYITYPEGQKNAMTLFSSDLLDTGKQFNSNWQADPENDYEGSNLKSVIDNLYADLFSPGEKTAVKNRTLKAGEYTDNEPYSTGVSRTETSGYLWPLSTAEARELPSNTFRSANDCWWLRSPGRNNTYAALVYSTGGVFSTGDDVDGECGVRPAFDLNLNSVLFTSAAEGGKSSGAEGVLNEVGTNSTNEWKLTLLDDGTITGLAGHKDFAINSDGITYDPEAGAVTVPYSGAVAGDHEYISAIITDKPISEEGAKIKYYGRIEEASEADDASGTINTAGKLEDGDTLYVFNEQYNGDKKTDYVSAPQEITIPQLISYDVTFKVVNGSWNDGTTADKTVTLSRYDNEDKALVLQSGDIPAVGNNPNQNYKAGSWDTTPDTDTAISKDTTYTYSYAKKDDPAPTPTPTKVSGTLLAKMTAKGKNSLVLTWNKVKGAEGYDIFFIKCGKESPKKVKTVKGNKNFQWTKKNLKKKTAYKAIVKAYVMKNGKKSYVRTSPMVHAYTSGWTKNYTNPKSVTVKKTSVSLKAGKTYKIKASVKKLKSGNKLMPSGHAPKLRYLSSNKKIATVSRSGQIRAKAKGSCKIYVYAVNGVSKTIKLTVR